MQLLIVCTANIARSPLAASMLAASLAPLGIEVVSAGTQARPDHPAAEASQEQARRRALDLAGHRSQPVTQDLVRDADLVLTMSERHRDQCAPLAAGAGSHVFTLREFVRLSEGLDLHAAPEDLPGRLTWAVQQAHLARPSASPAPGPENVHDPIRDPLPAWVAMGATLDQLCGRVVEVLGARRVWELPAEVEPQLSARADRTAARRGRLPWLGRSGR
jgi:protein-tyrosine phosphatase